jgi:cobalt-zinc-cadmium efflux system outer membrane protein
MLPRAALAAVLLLAAGDAGIAAAGAASVRAAAGAADAAAGVAVPPPTGRAPASREADAGGDPFAGLARLERETLLRAVVERNPSLEAARQAWRAADARRGGRQELPDPTLALAATPFAHGGGTAAFAASVELRQPLPLASRRRLGTAVAAAQTAGVLAGYRAALVELVAAASLLYDDYYMVYRQLALNAEHLRLAEEMRRAATDRYAAGLGPQRQALQAEIEAARLLHRQTELAVERELLAIRIQGMVHSSASRPLPPPPERLPAPPITGAAPASEAERIALAQSPEVAARRAAADARRADVELARLARRPDLELMGLYDSRWPAGGQRFLAGVAVGLPVRGERAAADRTAAEALLAQAESERSAAEDQVRAEARIAALRLDEADHVREIYQDRLLPASRDQLQAARAGFEVGQGSFESVIEAERDLRDVEIGGEQALVDLYRRQTELDRVLGRLPPGIEPAGGPPATAPSPRAAASRSGQAPAAAGDPGRSGDGRGDAP